MKKLMTLIGSGTIFLSACGGNNAVDTNKLTEVSRELNASANKFADGASRATRSLITSYDRLDRTLAETNKAANRVDQRAKKSEIILENNIKSLNKQLKKFENLFKEANTKLAKLEKLYISEGTLELTGESGKINLERFPATAQTKCQFMEDSTVDSSRVTGRVQSNGVWVINGKDYNLKEKMTFNYRASVPYGSTSTINTQLKSITFTNTHGEIVTSSKITGHLQSVDQKKSIIKLDTREINKKQQVYIPKDRKCILVLDAPLNLNIRQ